MTERLSDERIQEFAEIEKRAKAFHWQCSSTSYGTSPYEPHSHGNSAVAVPSTPADVLANDVLTLIAELRRGPVMPDTPSLEVLSAARDARSKHGMKPVYRAIRDVLVKEQSK